MTMDKSGKEKDGVLTPPGPQLQAGSEQTSAAEQITSKIEVDKQYGGADVKKMVEDALSADGREQKDRADTAEADLKLISGEHETLKTQFTTVSSQVAELLKAQNEAEADKVKDDPVALSSLRARQTNREEAIRLQGVEAAAKASQTKADEKLAEADKKLTSVNIKLAAMTASVDEKTLADLVPDGNPERLKRAATILKQSGFNQAPEIDPITGKPKPAALTQKPASAISAGGEIKTTAERMLEKAKQK